MTWRNDARAAWERLTGRGPDPLDALSDVATLRRQLDLAELEAVREARRARRSWTEIATRLGMTRQSAWEKWRDLDDEPAEPGGTVRGIVDDAVEGLAAEYGERVGVPDVVGLTWADARERLGAHRLVPKAADSRLRRRLRPDSTEYVVVEQEPAAGGRVEPFSTVTLWLGTGPGDAGDRAPLDPPPPPRARRGAVDETTGESVR
jgi:hypothetical protein